MKQRSPQSSLREGFNLSRLAIKYSRLAIACWIALIVAGIFAFSSLKYALFPDITFPVVIVQARSPLATALETETQLTQAIESPLESLANLDELYSSTYGGQTIVNVLFDAGTNLDAATEAVKSSLTSASLPPETQLDILPIDLNESAAIAYAITSDSKSLPELLEIAKREIIPEIEKLPDVLKVNLLGDSEKIQNPQLTKLNFPTLVRFNGRDAVAIEVIKRSRANTLELVDRVEKTVKSLSANLSDVKLVLAETQADYIREATQATIDALILAVILAILVIFPFLKSFRATLIAALAIPISLLGTCLVMAIAGLNLETITLLALALTIGIVVDDAIVDVENIARHIDRGENPKAAAKRGTDEIGLAVTASTLTIAAVFVPVAFMGGSVGQFFQPFGLTVSAAVLFSLLVARTLSPVLAVYWLKPKPIQNSCGDRLLILTYYRNLLRWSLHHRKMVVGIALASFIAGIALIPLIPKGFVPKLDRGEFNIVYTTPLPELANSLRANDLPGDRPQNSATSPPGNPSQGAFDWISQLAKSPERFLLRRTIRVGKQLEETVLASPVVESAFTIAGIRGEPNKGQIYVKLKRDRQLTTAEIQEQIRTALPAPKGVAISVEDIPFVQTEAEKPLQMIIGGDDLNVLHQTAAKIENQVEQLPSLTAVELSSQASTTEGLSKIERLNGQRVIYLSANLQRDRGLEDAVIRIEAVARPLLPEGITVKRWGSAAHSNDVLVSFGKTLIVSLFLMLGVLVLLFGRVLEPLVVGLSLPLSIVGAMLGLLASRSDFGVISLLGLLFLLGLLDKNAILLMDYTNQLRQAGQSREEAILSASTTRLRPIAMTTASTILGMLPIALGWGAGAELRQPMAVAIIGGLITSSLLSLIVVPVFYTLMEDYWNKLFKRSKLS